MTPKTVLSDGDDSESSDSNRTFDERALLDEFCREFLSSNGDLNVSSMPGATCLSDISCVSSTSDATRRSKNTAVSVGTSDGSKDLVLKWSTKDELIAILNEYTAILHGQATDDEQLIIDKTNKLLQALGGLPMRLREAIKEGWNGLQEQDNSTDEPAVQKAADHSISNDSNADSKKTGELLLDLKWKARSKIIEALTTNQSVAITNCRYVSSENKKRLVRENNKLIQMLLGLRARLVKSEIVSLLFAEQEC